MRLKSVYLLLAAAIIITSGCATTKSWNKTIDDKLFPRPHAGQLHKGFYLGLTQENQIYYHRYLFPNAFKNADRDYFEVLIPLDRSNKVAIARPALPPNLPKNPDYNALIEYNDTSFTPLNPKSAQIVEMFDQSVPKYPYPSGYPFFIKMTIARLGERPRIRFGQMERKPKNYSYLNDPLLNKYNFVGCTQSRYSSLYLSPSPSPSGDSDYTDCGLWYWSDVLVSSDTYEDLPKEVGYSALRYAGYLVTVPIDIILAPVRGLEVILVVIVFSNWSGH